MCRFDPQMHGSNGPVHGFGPVQPTNPNYFKLVRVNKTRTAQTRAPVHRFCTGSSRFPLGDRTTRAPVHRPGSIAAPGTKIATRHG
jgi:hypothetical protein